MSVVMSFTLDYNSIYAVCLVFRIFNVMLIVLEFTVIMRFIGTFFRKALYRSLPEISHATKTDMEERNYLFKYKT